MTDMSSIALGEIMSPNAKSIDPQRHPEEFFDLYSIPAFESQQPEVMQGKQIGSAKQLVNPGDVLLSKIVPHIRRSWVVGENRGRRLLASTEWIVFKNEQIHPGYLRYLLISDLFHVQFMRTVAGVGGSLMRARPAQVADIKIPIPPKADQQRIAEVLHRVEALRTLRRSALAQLETLVHATFVDQFGAPFTNPKGWNVGHLGDLATFVGGGTPSRARPEFFEGDICWATSKDMKNEYLDDTQEHITPQAIEQSATKLVPPGTILVVVKSKILAHSLPVAISRVPTCFGQDLKGIKVAAEQGDPQYVASALRLGKQWLLEKTRGANTEGLTLDHLREFPILLPPLPLQQTFARRVAAIDKLKVAHRASLAQLDELFASLQHRAFRGELSSHEPLRLPAP